MPTTEIPIAVITDTTVTTPRTMAQRCESGFCLGEFGRSCDIKHAYFGRNNILLHYSMLISVVLLRNKSVILVFGLMRGFLPRVRNSEQCALISPYRCEIKAHKSIVNGYFVRAATAI